MGLMRFYAPAPDALLPHAVARAHLANIESIPWRSRNGWKDGLLCIERDDPVSESGTLHIPWDVPGLGQLVLSTCTLMERPAPYHLATELARGTLYRARMSASDLESAEVAIPAPIRNLLDRALAAFLTAATVPASADEAAADAIRIASHVIARLCQEVILPRIRLQRESSGPFPSLLAGRLDDPLIDPRTAPTFLDAFHAASLPFRWRDLQPTADQVHYESVDTLVAWCQAQGLRLLGGPLIQTDRGSLPEWICGHANRYDALEEAARRYVRGVVRRYDESMDVWVCAGRLNLPGALGLSEEHRLRLAVAMIETVCDASSQTPVVISFDQPWAEYLAIDNSSLSPLHFADALVRAELGVAGIALEMNLGYWPGGCLPRDLLAISRHLDRWSLLGMPLIIYLTMPSRAGPDPLARGDVQVVPRTGEDPAAPAMDQDLARHLLPLLLSKPALHAIVWNQWSDGEPHEFPHSGALDQAGRAKPLLALLGRLRRELLA